MSNHAAALSVPFLIDAGDRRIPRSCWLYVLEWDDWALDAPATTLREYQVDAAGRLIPWSGPGDGGDDEARDPSSVLRLPLECNGGAVLHSFLLTRARLDDALKDLLTHEAAELLPAVDLSRTEPGDRDPSLRQDESEMYWVRAVDPVTDSQELAKSYIRALNRQIDFELHPGEHQWERLARALDQSIVPLLEETDLSDDDQAALREKVDDTLRKAEAERARRLKDTERCARALIDLLESSLWTRYVAGALLLRADPSEVLAYTTFWIAASDRLADCVPGRRYMAAVLDLALSARGEADSEAVRDYLLPLREPEGRLTPALKAVAGSTVLPLALENLLPALIWLRKGEAAAILQRALDTHFGQRILELSTTVMKLKPLRWLGDRWLRVDVEVVSAKLSKLSGPAKQLEGVCTLLNLGMALLSLRDAIKAGNKDEIMPSLLGALGSVTNASAFVASVRSLMVADASKAGLKTLTRRLGTVGALFEVGSGLWSAQVALKQADYDQASWRLVGVGASGLTIWGLAVEAGVASAVFTGGTLLAAGVIIGVVAGVAVVLTQDDAMTVFLKNCHFGPLWFGQAGGAPSFTGVKRFDDDAWKEPKVQLQALFNLFAGISVSHKVEDARDVRVVLRMITPESVLHVTWYYSNAQGGITETEPRKLALADRDLKVQGGNPTLVLDAPDDVPHTAREHWVGVSLDLFGDQSVWVPPPDRWMWIPIRQEGVDARWDEKLNSWEH